MSSFSGQTKARYIETPNTFICNQNIHQDQVGSESTIPNQSPILQTWCTTIMTSSSWIQQRQDTRKNNYQHQMVEAQRGHSTLTCRQFHTQHTPSLFQVSFCRKVSNPQYMHIQADLASQCKQHFLPDNLAIHLASWLIFIATCLLIPLRRCSTCPPHMFCSLLCILACKWTI